jgi:hypothetical protein
MIQLGCLFARTRVRVHRGCRGVVGFIIVVFSGWVVGVVEKRYLSK